MDKPTPASNVDPFRLPEVLWAEDVARILGVQVVQARRVMRSGKIPARKIGKRWYALREEFLKILRP